MKRVLHASPLAVALWAWGCGGDSTPAAPTPTSLAVNCVLTTLTKIGQQTQCTAFVILSSGVMQDQTAAVQWSSSSTAVAAVSSTGLVTAVSIGSATLRATTTQGVSGTQTLTVSVVPTAAVSVRFSATGPNGLIVAIQDVTLVTFDVSGSTGAGLSYRIQYGDGTIDTTPLPSFPGRGTEFQHTYHATGTFAAQLVVTDAQNRQASASTFVTVKNLTGIWGNVIKNPSTGLTEARLLQLIQGGAQGGLASLTGSYTHPAGNSEPLKGTVEDTGTIRNLALNSGTITFDGNTLDGNGANSDVSAIKLTVKGGSADGLTLTFVRQ